jgi:MoaA/NifB/PqqE/SkfB family radical SAM enzyme
MQNLSAPLHVDFEITGHCQLRCSYCSAMPLGGPHAPTKRILEIIEELAQSGVFSLLLSGGEPTLHPDFLNIMASVNGAIPKVAVNTNGIRFANNRFTEDFKITCPSSFVSVSLDSPDIVVNDRWRGAGGTKAIKAIKNCTGSGINVGISAVLTQDSMKSGMKLIDEFAPSVKHFRFFPRVARNSDDLESNDESLSGKFMFVCIGV